MTAAGSGRLLGSGGGGNTRASAGLPKALKIFMSAVPGVGPRLALTVKVKIRLTRRRPDVVAESVFWREQSCVAMFNLHIFAQKLLVGLLVLESAALKKAALSAP
jgi:hypothetical protein